MDDNQNEIVTGLRAIGAHVLILSSVGQGVPDILVLFRRKLILLELKDGAKKKSAQRLTPPEVRFHDEWQEAPLFVVSSVSEAYKAIGAEVEA